MPDQEARPLDATPLRAFVSAFTRAVADKWLIIVAGPAFALALGLIPGMLGEPAAPWVWAVAGIVAVLPACFAVWRREYIRAETLEDARRIQKRAQEQASFNIPRGVKRADIARWAYQAETPSGLTPEGNVELGRLYEKATVRLERDADLMYTIKRERHSHVFGPFDDLQVRYGRLTREDVKAELSKLQEYGLAEKIKDGEHAGRYRWTEFAYGVFGKLGQRLS